MVCGIYAILNLLNGKYYIGSAINFSERWRLHLFSLSKNKHHNRHLQSAYNKYGADNFLFVVLEYTDWLEQREQWWIDSLQSTDINLGYNICAAGRNRFGVTASEETRQKLSIAHMGNVPSAETRAKMSASRIGNTINNGRKQTPETIAKRIAKTTGRKRSAEARARMSAAQTGRIFSEESRLKMRLAKLGTKASEAKLAKMRGPRNLSAESRAKLSEAAKRRWNALDNQSVV